MADLHIKFLENLWESPMHSSKPPQLVFVEQNSGSAISLSDKAKLSLYKKSVNSGISADILEEVYSRGYNTWNESFGGSPDQFAFDRVNSFISGGFAFQLDEDLLNKKTPSVDKIAKKFKKPEKEIENAVTAGSKVEKEHTKSIKLAKEIARDHLGERPDYYNQLRKMEKNPMKEEKGLEDACWKGYEAVGFKKKNGKRVPNCVPVEEARKIKTPHESSKHFKTKETVEPQSTDPNDPDSRFDGTDSALGVYKNATPGQSATKTIKRVVRETIEEATYKGRKVSLNKPFRTPGGPKKSAVYVDPDGDGNAKIVRFGDPNLSIKKNQPARKRSYCARSSGQGNLTKKDSANYWSRRAWNCEETIEELSVPLGTTGKRGKVSTPLVSIRMASGKIEKHPPGKSGSSGGGGDEE
jgi:hypothetical protein